MRPVEVRVWLVACAACALLAQGAFLGVSAWGDGTVEVDETPTLPAGRPAPPAGGVVGAALTLEEEREQILQVVMPDSKVIERLRITDRAIQVNVAALLAQGYQGAQQVGDFVVYTRTARSLDPTIYDGYYERGDPMPAGLTFVFAWKADGTAYVGTRGTDAEQLAALVEGYAKIPFTERFVGVFLESYAFRGELRTLVGQGLASGVTQAELDQNYYPFLGSLEHEVYHRFGKPVHRVASAVYLQSIAQPTLPPPMLLWSPLPSWGTGTGSRSFRLTVTGAVASYVVAVANNDNADSSEIRIDGQAVVSNTHCCENYWRRTGRRFRRWRSRRRRRGRRGRRCSTTRWWPTVSW